MLSMFKPHKILPSNPDFEKLRPNFGWLPKDVVKATIENSTQWYQGENRFPMRHHIKSRFPAANVNHLPDTVSYDTLFSDTPALDNGIKGHGGCTMMEIFYAKPSQLVYGVPLSAKRNVPDAVKDFIRRFGAPTAFLSDSATENKGYKIEDVERNYNISRHHYSEPEYQNQNWVENKIGQIKNMVNNIMDITGTPAACWLICTLYVISLMQIISQPSLGGMSAMQKVTGFVQDTSKCLHYHWWQPVYYLDHDVPYPSQSCEKLDCWCGWADDHGDILTYWILTEDTKQLIPASDIRPVHI